MKAIRIHQGHDRQEAVTVVIPAFNEAAGLGATLDGLRRHPRLAGVRVLVIDDGSTDGTAEIARDHGAEVLVNRVNQGYGASLKRGIEASETPLVAWYDADGQHRADDLA